MHVYGMSEVCGPYSLNEWQPQDILGRGPVAGKDLRDLAGGSQAPDRPSRGGPRPGRGTADSAALDELVRDHPSTSG